MLSLLQKTRDTSGHSGQTSKHWPRRCPESHLRLGTGRDRKSGSALTSAAVPMLIHSDVDFTTWDKRPMSCPERTVA